VPGSSSSTTHTTPAASSYEETVVAGLHLHNIILDSSSTTYASWRDLMMMVLERYVVEEGAVLRMSCPYTSPQNGKAERIIRSINNVIRTLLFQANLPGRYWAEGLHTATYLLNRLPTKTI
jgi:hypothetical protein